MIKLVFIFLMTWTIDGSDVAKVNGLKKEGEKAFKAGNYTLAAEKFSYLIDSMNIDDENAVLNLGHSYFQLGKNEEAQNQYMKLILSENEELKSIAYQQLGALSNDPKTLQKALSFFKSALKANPRNEDARYNYELIKKKLTEQQDQDQDQENKDDQQENEDQKDQEKQDQENQEGDQEGENEDGENQESEDQNEQSSEDQEGEGGEQDQNQENQQEGENDQEQEQQQNQEGQEGDQEEQQDQQNTDSQEGQENEEQEQQEGQAPPSTSDKLKEMNISEEKAKMILEALKNSEIQYIQQNRRRPTNNQSSDKPDW
ncbi:tetratricopeptide repeat protein [Reichenbachiella agariperforans]|uniref:tetratricopeptide repeat protein n=1 Tax=Reichenbachiella agariperforans TaxID=156994 RepID=UPI001C08CF6B|nr:hypothetical protein [Reichenbachiella agariperforans]MBU2914306.1 hypothetical protein [Reichenbachiella agariperforans]